MSLEVPKRTRLVCYLEAQGEAACGDVGLALVPGHAGRLDERLQFVGEQLLGGVEQLT